ncbi:MAG: hypothetical protein U0176_17865 [Bacteroidia bacterium]
MRKEGADSLVLGMLRRDLGGWMWPPAADETCLVWAGGGLISDFPEA